MSEIDRTFEMKILPSLAIVSTDNFSVGPFLYINHDYIEYACYQDWKDLCKNRDFIAE
jgi:hypothetical protein